MAVEVIMPKFGLTMQDGTIQRYFKSPGESVRAGEPLYEVETEKVLYEVEAPTSGTLAVALFPEGTTVECGAVVAVIAESGEDLAAVGARYGDGAGPQAGAPARAGAGAAGASQGSARPSSAAPPASASSAAAAADDAGARRAVSPVARKLAAELGVDLARISGTGPGGRITREDVERAATPAHSTSGGNAAAPAVAEAGAGAPAGAPAPAPATAIGKPHVRSVPMRGMRKTIADRMSQSLHQSAQLTITTEADVTAAVELRERLVRQFDFTYGDLLIQAVARALLRHPRMNARLAEDAIVIMPQVNVGMAVALEDGLIVPVIAEADKKSLREIAAATRELGERARAGKLRLEEVSGGTFTITNLGTYGVDAFTPIINPGETGILGVGRIIEKPVIHRGEIARRSMMTLSLTFDHRLIDGAPAAQFLQTVIEIFNFGER
jgi:pyruvate dehydrogenase E2 component (dihydrolipoyllysine-residue acetyltransferase)